MFYKVRCQLIQYGRLLLNKNIIRIIEPKFQKKHPAETKFQHSYKKSVYFKQWVDPSSIMIYITSMISYHTVFPLLNYQGT